MCISILVGKFKVNKIKENIMKKIASVLMLTMLFASNAFGTASVLPPPISHFDDSAGRPCNGCKVCFFEVNSSTPKAVYTDASATTALGTSVTLNSRGESPIWITGPVKVKLMAANQTNCSTGTAIWTSDNVSSMPFTTPEDLTTGPWIAAGALSTYISATQFSVTGDYTDIYPVGMRIKATITGNAVYGRVTASAYASGTTTVTVSLDSGSLDAATTGTDVNVSIMKVTGSALSADMLTSGTSSAYLTLTGTISSSGTNTLSGTQNVTGTAVFTGPVSLPSTTITGAGSGSGLDADKLDGMNAASSNAGETIVARNPSGDFAAGTITATLTGNVTGNASGSSGSCTGNSATATSATQISGKAVYFGSVVWAPGTINAGSGAETTLTVTGAQVGDNVIITPPHNNLAAYFVNAYATVSATNTVMIHLANANANGYTFSSQTWRIIVVAQ